jgi:hypothetical protein
VQELAAGHPNRRLDLCVNATRKAARRTNLPKAGAVSVQDNSRCPSSYI